MAQLNVDRLGVEISLGRPSINQVALSNPSQLRQLDSVLTTILMILDFTSHRVGAHADLGTRLLNLRCGG